jgi:hypothetical protein
VGKETGVTPVKLYDVKAYASKISLKLEDQLAWEITRVVADKVALPPGELRDSKPGIF